jgi:hypothetical protein
VQGWRFGGKAQTPAHAINEKQSCDLPNAAFNWSKADEFSIELIEHGANLRVGAFLPEIDPHLGIHLGTVRCMIACKRTNRHEVNST